MKKEIRKPVFELKIYLKDGSVYVADQQQINLYDKEGFLIDKISVADIAGRLLPFAVPIGVYHIKGKFLPLMLEGAINNATNNSVKGTGDGSYPYTYNLSFDYFQDEELGQRVQNLKLFDGTTWCTVENEEVYICIDEHFSGNRCQCSRLLL